MAKQKLDIKPRGAAEPTAAEVTAALERILRSRCFAHASRASDFLRFVVDKTLAGERAQLKGYTIAIHVFGRPADFDAKTDPLVRVEALRLRQRLTEYYAGEGSGERVRLEMPRGGYVMKASYAWAEPQRVEIEQPTPPGNGVAALWTRARLAAVAAAALLVSVGTVPMQQQAPVVDPTAAAAMAALSHRTQHVHVLVLARVGRMTFGIEVVQHRAMLDPQILDHADQRRHLRQAIKSEMKVEVGAHRSLVILRCFGRDQLAMHALALPINADITGLGLRAAVMTAGNTDFKVLRPTV